MWLFRPNGRSVLQILLVGVLCCNVLGKSTFVHNKSQDEPQPGKKRASAGTEAGTEAATGANTGAATASDTSSESQTFTNTKVNTRIATSSNARSGANAAAKVKTYAHANTETKVDTQQQKPTPPPEIPATTTPGGPDIFPPPPGPGKDKENGTCEKCKEKEIKPPIIKVYCPNCPCPCPPPCPCVCPCPPPPPPPPPPPCPVPCLPPCPPPCEPVFPQPCPVPCPAPCPCNVQMLGPHFDPSLSCPMDCPLPPCPCPYKRDKILQRLRRKRRRRAAASKRVHTSGKQPNLAYAKPLEFGKAAVAADNVICSKMGRDILKRGGTAADAVVTTHCCVEIVNSHSTGLGGGGFMVYYDRKSGKSTSYDFRETLPIDYKDTQNKTLGETILVPGVLRGLEAVWKDFGKLNWTDLWQPCIDLAENGFYIHEALSAGIDKKADYIMANLGLRDKTQGDTVLVPGVLKGIHAVWKDYGTMEWKDLWEPCVKLCNKGFKIHDALHNAIQAKADYIMQNKNLSELFAPHGRLLRLGDTLRRPQLAKTFQRIADSGGCDIFYKGEMAREIEEDIMSARGCMRQKDLSDYDVVRRDPLKTTIKGLTVLTTPPPGSGALISLALKIMSFYNWTADSQYNERALLFHRVVESFKFAYAPFTFLGDPKKTDHTEEVCKYMLDDKVAMNMKRRIDNISHTVDYYEPFSKAPRSDSTGTSHMSIIDQDGSGLGATTSVNAYFGSKLRSSRLGFIYNNELADFSEFWPHVYNLTTDKKIPGKRPMSKSSPTIFLDRKGATIGVFGAAGGFFIPTCLIQAIANWLFFHNNIKVAISKPRLHCQLFPPTVVYEPTFPQELIPQLESFSHAYVTNSTYDVSGQLNAIMGVVQAIVRLPNGKLNADCDYRKGGEPAGF